MWNCNMTGLLSVEAKDANLLGLTGTFPEAAPKFGDLREVPNHSLRGVYGGAHVSLCTHCPAQSAGDNPGLSQVSHALWAQQLPVSCT